MSKLSEPEPEIRTAYWWTLTGSPKMKFLEQDGKLYISVDDAVGVVMKFRLKLMRLGMLKLTGLNPSGIVELFTILADHFRAIEKLKREPPKEQDYEIRSNAR